MTDVALAYDDWVVKAEWTDMPLGPELQMPIGVYRGCILVSGYADDQKVKLAQAMGAGAFFKKPYTYRDFGRAVRTERNRA